MACYLDTNVIISAIIPDGHTEAALSWLKGVKSRLLVGTFTTAEVAAVIARLIRSRLLTEADGRYAQETFDDWLRFDADLSPTSTADIQAAQGHVRKLANKLSAPDAIHVAQARRLDAILVTFDKRLAVAGRNEGLRVTVPT